MIEQQEKATAPDAARVRKPRRWRRRLLIAALVPILLYLSREYTVHPLLVRSTPWLSARFAPYDVRLSDIDGNWFGDLRLEGLVVRPRGEEDVLQGLTAEEIEARYSLLGLVRGEERWLLSVRAIGVDGDVVLGASEEEATEDEEPSQPPALPRLLPEVQVERLSLRVTQPDGSRIEVERADLSIADAAEGQRVELALPFAFTPAEGARRAHTLDAALRWSAAAIEAQNLTLDETPLLQPGGTVDLRRLQDGRIEWDLGFALPGDRAHTSGVLEGQSLRANVDFARIDLGALRARFADIVPELPADLAGLVSLDGELDLTLGELRPSGSLRVLASDVFATERRLSSFELLATSDGETATLTRLTAQAPGGRVEALDLSVSLASLLPDDLLGSLTGSLAVDADALGELLHGARVAELPELPAHVIDIDLRFAGGAAELAAGRVDIAGGHVDLTGGRVELRPSATGARAASIQLDVDLPDLAAVGALLDKDDWAGALSGEGSLSGDLPYLQGHLELTGADVLIAGIPLGALEISADVDRERARITSCETRSDEATAQLSGAWVLESSSLEGLVLDVQVLEPRKLADLVAEGGHLKVHAEFDGTPDALAGSLSIDGALLRAGGQTIQQVTVNATVLDGIFDVTELRAEVDQGTLDGRLVATLPREGRALDVRLSALTLTGQDAQLALTAPVTLSIEGERIALEAFELAGNAGRIALDATLVGARTDAHLAIEDLDPMGFLTGLAPDGVVVRGISTVLDIDIDPDKNLFSVSGSGKIAELRAPGDDGLFDLAWRGALKDGRATLDELRATTGGEVVLDVSASLPLDPLADELLADGSLAINGELTLPSGRRFQALAGERNVTVTGLASVTLDLDGTWSGLLGTIDVDAHSITVESDGDTPTDVLLPEPATLSAHVAFGPERVTLEGLRLSAPQRAHIDLSGALQLTPDIRTLARGTLDWQAAEFELKGDYGVPALSWVVALSEQLRRLEGIVEGDVDLRGTLAAPTGSGSFSLRDGAVRVAGATGLERLAIDAQFANDTLTLSKVYSELGAAPLNISGAIAGLTGDSPTASLQIDGSNVLLVRSAATRLRADLDLTLVGPLDGLTVGGDVHLRNGRITQTIDFLGMLQGVGTNGVSSQQSGIVIAPFEDGPLAALTFDIDVDTAEPISIITNVARGSVSVGLHLGGTGELIIPDGRVYLEPTRIALPGGRLTMQGGTIEMNPDEPLFPRLNLFGDTRMLGYDVTVAISGRYDRPVVDLSSVPPLPKDDLLVMLLTGNLPSGATGAQAAQALTIYLAKDLLARWADDGLESDGESLLDRLEFISGRDVSKAGVLTMEATYKLREDLLDERDVLFIVAERDRYEDYNLGLRFVLRLK